MRISTWIPIAALALGTAVFSTRALGQMPDFDAPPPNAQAPGERPPLFNVMLGSSYTGSSRATLNGSPLGDHDAATLNLAASGRIPLTDHLIVPISVSSENAYLDARTRAPLPDAVHTLQLGTGLGIRPNEEWMIMMLVNPTLYKWDHVERKDIGVSGGVIAMWNRSPSVRFLFGFMVAPDSQIKALPLLGVDWQIDERWELKALIPEPALIYHADERWAFHLGANLNQATFRTSTTLGDPLSDRRYNDALATYRDVRAGAGFSVQLDRRLSLAADAGYSVSRALTYTRLDETIHFKPAPYARLTLQARF